MPVGTESSKKSTDPTPPVGVERFSPRAIEVPPSPVARRSLYLKVRDRESYEFALLSVAVAVQV